MTHASGGPRKSPVGAAPARVRDVLRLAWPSVLSFVCNSAYRVNDQFWVKDLGADAHAALGGTIFLLTLNFSIYFLVVSGSLSLVARATGAGDSEARDRTVQHALVCSCILALVLSIAGTHFAPQLIHAVGLRDETARLAREYLATIYLGTLPLALAPVVDTVFIGMGNTLIPFLLQLASVFTNFVLNPCLIYGYGPFEEYGISGAAIATCVSRAVVAGIGLFVLGRRFGVRWFPTPRLSLKSAAEILRIGLPSSVSITAYAAVYLILLRLVITPLGRDVVAGFGIGFNAFEGISFPFYLGIAVAGSSLVGRNLGAGAIDATLLAIRNVRRVALTLGVAISLLFFFAAPLMAPLFTTNESVLREATLYLRILAFSQAFVALEAASEKVLLGAGRTLPIFLISFPGNALRIPLAYWFVQLMAPGAAGIWWAINLSTLVKALAFLFIVERSSWKPSPPDPTPAG